MARMATLRLATDVRGMKASLAPRHLELGELDDFFVETNQARDPALSRRVELRLLLETPGPVKVLLVGHRGSGKSTELTKFIEENPSTFVVVRVSALEESLLGQVTVEKLLVLVVASMTASSSPRVTEEHVHYGLGRLTQQLVRGIGVHGLPAEFGEVTTDSLWERLRALKGRSGRLPSDTLNLLLIQAQALVEYNGQGWHRVHPLIERHLEQESA